MKISGFTIVKDAVINDYPVLEAIRSILPMVDEMIVAVGDSRDNTLDLIRSISSDKIRIVQSTWDATLKHGGHVLAAETNKAFRLISPDCTWAFYIQADEVVHEKYHENIRRCAGQYKDDKSVDGLLFNYLHFYGTYDYVGDSRRWYNREVRMIRNDPSISAYRDAQGFRRDGKRLRVKPIESYIYHYGWVKSPLQMQEKHKNLTTYWQDNEEAVQKIFAEEVFDFNDFDALKRFTGTHPAIMQQRIMSKDWHIELDLSKKKLSWKNWVLYLVEKLTGRRLFVFRNYTII